MKIVLQPHLKIRLAQRKIPQNYPERIITNPDSKYFDTATNHFIAIKRLNYNQKLRPMVVSYDIIGDIIQIVTVHPVNDQQIQNKLKRRRWIKNEES